MKLGEYSLARMTHLRLLDEIENSKDKDNSLNDCLCDLNLSFIDGLEREQVKLEQLIRYNQFLLQ